MVRWVKIRVSRSSMYKDFLLLVEAGYSFVDGVYTGGAASPGIINPNLTWLKSKTLNIGIDVGLFKGLLNFEMDLYQRDRKGLLAKRNLSLPNTFGGSLPDENINSDRVRGIDLSVSS